MEKNCGHQKLIELGCEYHYDVKESEHVYFHYEEHLTIRFNEYFSDWYWRSDCKIERLPEELYSAVMDWIKHKGWPNLKVKVIKH